MTRRNCIALALLLGACFAAPPSYADEWPAEPVKGVLSGGSVYVCAVVDIGAVLRWSTLDGKARSTVRADVDFLVPPCRWHLTKSHAWFNDTRGSSPSEPATMVDSIHRYELPDLLKDKPLTAPGAEEGRPYPAFMQGGTTKEDRLSETRAKIFFMGFKTNLHYDYLPVSAESIRLFVLTDIHGNFKCTRFKFAGDVNIEDIDFTMEKIKDRKWSFRVYGYTTEWGKAKLKWTPGKWSSLESIAVGFKDSFQVIARGDDYYFVTGAGKVYRAPKAGKGKERKLEAVWDDAKRPVTAFIQDADSGAAYAFCKADKEGKGVYFEFAAKPKPVAYDAKGIKSAKRDDPLPAILGYARILVADKRLKAE
jgi:hypothetical protein